MKTLDKKIDLKINKAIPVDKFVEKALYNHKVGYYTNRFPFGNKGDFITAPTISNLFSEIIAIWIISSWEKFDKPKTFNFVELGPGDGSLSKVLVNTFKKFPKFNKAVKIYLYEKSNFLIKIQKEKLKNEKVKWVKHFNMIKDGPVIFFGNEFFDAIPIKQFRKSGKIFKEKYFKLDGKYINEIYKKASEKDTYKINTFKTLNKLKFIEYPKLGFLELDKVTKKIFNLNGGILLIDYGYLNKLEKNTLQVIMKNRKIKIKSLIKNFGKADITSLVNFGLLKEYFNKCNLKVMEVVTQKYFLERMGIIKRAEILEKNMTSSQKNYISSTLNRLLNKQLMGELFKVIFAFKHYKNNFFGFK